MLSSVTDVNGTTVKYTYGAPYSQITGITDGNGNKTSYTYNALGELTSAKMNVSGLKTLLSDRTITDSSDEIKAEYVYKQGRLTEIHYGDCVYAFTYDKWGNILRAAMNEKILVRYDYGDAAYKGLVQSAVYSTGQSVYYTYNSLGQVSTVGYAQGNVSFIYTYDSDGTLTKIFDKDYNITTEFTDDGYTIYKGTSENVLYFYNGTEEEYIENVLGKVLSFEVENDGSVTIQSVMNEVNGANLYSEQTAYDAFERLDEKILSAGSLNITQSYDYVTNGNITGDRVSDYGISYNQGEDTNNLHFTYTYDGNGNITSVEKTEETADGAVTYKTEYTYDEAGQLKTAYDEELGIRYSYVYDAYGNIVERQSYSVNADGESTLIEQKVYEYDGMVLTNTYSTLEGETEYQTNEMGNLTGVAKNDETYLYSWGMGRLLNQIVSESGNDRVIYDYNEEGLRIKKVLTVDGVSSITDYVWGKNGLAGYTRGTDTVVVLYGTDGTPIGFSLNDTVYTYIKNLQGDVIRVLDTSGNTVVEYSYDPWGVPAITGDTELAAINPCSYRCYDYDEESGYYYLQSRYYNPETGRFLNADDTEILLEKQNSILQYNHFSYCWNNPVNLVDYFGKSPANIIGGIFGGVTGATLGYLLAKELGLTGWKKAGLIAAATIGGAALGAFLGPYMSKLLKSLGSTVKQVGKNATTGACFIEGTLVFTATGNVPIEKVEVGDYVYSENVITGEKGLKKVISKFERTTREIVSIDINGEKLNTTPEHPVYVLDRGWVKAKDLCIHDKVKLANEQIDCITGIQHKKYKNDIIVYNFEVDDFHTYYVGEKSVLVHNAACGLNNLRTLKETTIKGYKVSMDLERGGSGLINIHIKVNNTKYYYKAGKFISSAGKEIPKSLRDNEKILNALKKALEMIEKGW